MDEHWLILGASSAMARAFSRIAANRGFVLTFAGRDLEDLTASASDAGLRGSPQTRVILCDVTDPVSCAACIANAVIPDTTLNVLLTIGNMPEQSAMDLDSSLLSRMIETTYSGPIALMQGLAPNFERQQGGRIVIIGSVAGDRGRRNNYLYGSAKSALATYAEGLRARLFPSGATVTLVKPGFIDTSMTWGLPGLFFVASPKSCAIAMMRAAEQGRAEIYYPFFWRFIMLIIRHIPALVMKRLQF